MRWLIRRVLKKGKGSVSYEEDVHYGDVLTIGRAADQAIFLPDMRAALNHARVTLLGSNEYKIESLILAGIRVNGSISYVTTAGAGTVVEVGDTRLTLLAAPQDFEGAVEVSTLDKREQQAEKQKRSKPTRLSQTGISKRRPSWILFIAILAFGLILPMIGHFVPSFGQMLKHSPLPSTSSWNPGTLEAAHQYFGDNCTKCHQYAFLTVRDKACLSCHKDTPAHADPAKFNLPQLGNAQCRSCHKDHEGLNGLIRKDQSLCSDCHRDLKSRTKGASKLVDVSDFGTSHPQFRVELPAWTPDGKFSPRLATLAPDIKENSGLVFSHVKHLKPDGLNTPNGHRVLKCASCHKPDAGGANMRPINFEAMCHDCHKLGFDTLAPKREVPHGKVAAVIYTLNEYYAKVALEGGYKDAKSPAIVQQRRRPGAPPMSEQQKQVALAWASQQAARALNNLFVVPPAQSNPRSNPDATSDRSGCALCHDVTPPKGANDIWHVAPVRVSGIWYADAKFTHAKHRTMNCEDCHAANKSEKSSDLLIPGIKNCRACHGGAKARNKVATTCIACHNYHQSVTLKMGTL